jgi:hypothetical protein
VVTCPRSVPAKLWLGDSYTFGWGNNLGDIWEKVLDHRLVSQLTWNTWRDHRILEYEIMNYDGDLGRPNFYVPLPEDMLPGQDSGIVRGVTIPSQATMVRRADILVIAAAARRRMQCSLAPCRSVLRKKNRCLIASRPQSSAPSSRLLQSTAKPADEFQ